MNDGRVIFQRLGGVILVTRCALPRCIVVARHVIVGIQYYVMGVQFGGDVAARFAHTRRSLIVAMARRCFATPAGTILR